MLNKEYQKDTDSPLARRLATGIMRLTCEHLSQLNAPYTKPDLSGEKKSLCAGLDSDRNGLGSWEQGNLLGAKNR